MSVARGRGRGTQPGRDSGPGDASTLDRALRLLAGRPHAAAELRLKLRHRGHDPAEIEAALARLRELGYLDDAAFARSLAGWRSGSRGRRAIAAELSARGVPRDVAAEVLAEADPEAERAAARALASKLLRPPAVPEQVARVAARLRRRGFGEDAITSAVRSLGAESSD